MTVVDRSTENAQLKNDPPFSATCWRRPDAMRGVTAFGLLARRVGKINSVLEPFGGCGWHSMYIQRHCEPSRHLVGDISKDCTDSVKKSFGPGVDTFTGDFQEQKFKRFEFDWVHADAQSYTFDRVLKGMKKWTNLLKMVFRASSRYVSITDSAVYGIVRFQQNRDAYARSIGMDPKKWEDYFRATSERYQEMFGFGVRHVVTWSGQACYMLMERGAETDFEIEKFQDRAKMKLIETEEV